MTSTTYTLVISLKNGKSIEEVCSMAVGLRPRVYDGQLGGYRSLVYVESGAKPPEKGAYFRVEPHDAEVHLIMVGINGSDATSLWGAVKDEVFSKTGLSCSFKSNATGIAA